MRFVEKLREASHRADSLVCVGLDVDPAVMPASLQGVPEAVLQFNKAIVDATADLVCAYKPNLAFYEALGPVGWEILAKTLRHIPRGVITIADAKRGDIGHTARAYARAVFEVYGFDAVTVNPYLGLDSVQPFLDYADRGVFVLCKTSNPGSNQFQNLQVQANTLGERGGRRLFEFVAETVVQWNAAGNCGLVVGATYPSELASVRRIASELPILVPGVGAQGGDLEEAVRCGVDARGELLLVNSSRAILYASSGDDFAQAARRATERLREAINDARRSRAAQ